MASNRSTRVAAVRSTSSSCSTTSFHSYTLEIGTRWAHATSFASTSASAILVASSREPQVMRTSQWSSVVTARFSRRPAPTGSPPGRPTGGGLRADGDGYGRCMSIAPSPTEIYERSEQEGRRRLSMSGLEQTTTAFMAGITIVFGIAALGVVDSLVAPQFGSEFARLLGALGFAIGVVFLIVGRTELFTENFFGPVAAAIAHSGRRRWGLLLRLWVVTLVFNFIGGAVLVAVVAVVGAPGAGRARRCAADAAVLHAVGREHGDLQDHAGLRRGLLPGARTLRSRGGVGPAPAARPVAGSKRRIPRRVRQLRVGHGGQRVGRAVPDDLHAHRPGERRQGARRGHRARGALTGIDPPAASVWVSRARPAW